MWPYAYDFLSDKEQSKISEGQVGLTQVPVAAEGVLRAGDQDAAWKLIAAPEQQETMALGGSYLPTRTEL